MYSRSDTRRPWLVGEGAEQNNEQFEVRILSEPFKQFMYIDPGQGSPILKHPEPTSDLKLKDGLKVLYVYDDQVSGV